MLPVDLPYWRLSGFYFFFFAVVGSLVPYWAPYLQSLGFSAAEIGELVAIFHATKLVAPYVWGWIADHTGRRMRIVRLGAFVALVSYAGVLLGDSYLWLAVVMACFSFFWNAALPQFEANTLNHLGTHAHDYPRIRLWGSIGFIIAVVGVGELLDRLGVDSLPYIVLVFFAMLWIATLVAPERERESHRFGSVAGFSRVLGQWPVIGFFVACFLLQASHGPYYTFFSIYLEDHGYGGFAIGALWGWGVLAEILVFLIIHRALRAFSPRMLLVLAMGLGVIRWLMTAWLVDSLPWLVLAQSLHAATYGVYHAVGISLVNRFFVGRHQGRGQALYSSLTFGAGVAVGSFLSGRLWESLGGSATYAVAAVACLAAALVAAASLSPAQLDRASHHD